MDIFGEIDSCLFVLNPNMIIFLFFRSCTMLKYLSSFLRVSPIDIVMGVLLCSLLLLPQVCFSQDVSMTYEKFETLSPSEMKNVLIKAFEKRIRASRNIHVSYEITGEQRKYDEGQVGELIVNYPVDNYSLWICGGKYRVDLARYKFSDHSPIDENTIVFDSNEGINKGMVFLNGNKDHIFGRIDTSQYALVFGFYSYWIWLADDYCDEITIHHLPRQFYFFSHLLKTGDNWKISLVPENKTVRLICPCPTNHAIKEANNEGSFVLDPSKDFMLVSVRMKFDEIHIDGRKWGMDQSYEIKESKLVDGGIWMPTELELYSQASWVENKINIHRIKVNDISFGKVSSENIDFKYPEGTDVVDVIEGVHYKTDANGEPIESTKEFLYGLDTSKVKLPEKKHEPNYVLIVSGLLLFLIAVYLIFRKNKKSP
jgi:hypothetical protein